MSHATFLAPSFPARSIPVPAHMPERISMSDAWSFETKQIHAGQQPDEATNARALPDLPDDVVHLQEHRPRGGPVRTRGVRQHLHAHHEPDAGRRRGAGRRARGRRRRAAGGERPGGRDDRDPQHRERRRPHRLEPEPLRRHVQPLPLHAPEARHRGLVRRGSRRPRVVARRRPTEHQGLLRRDHRQPQERLPRHRDGRRRSHTRTACR